MPRLNPLYDPIVDDLIRAHHRGEALIRGEVRAKYGLTSSQIGRVSERLAAIGIKLKATVEPMAPEDDAEVLRLHAEGHSIRVISERMKRSRWIISAIISGGEVRPRHRMTAEAKADRAVEAQQRAERLAAGQGDDAEAPPPWRKIIPCPRVVASLRHYYRSHEAAYEAAQRDVFRRRHGVSIAQ